jgi:hypothetical protein
MESLFRIHVLLPTVALKIPIEFYSETLLIAEHGYRPLPCARNPGWHDPKVEVNGESQTLRPYSLPVCVEIPYPLG